MQQIQASSSSCSFLFSPIPSSSFSHQTINGSNTKPSLYFHQTHLFKPLQASQNPSNCVDKERREGDLRFVRGKKLLSDLSTLRIGGPCNYFIEVFDHAQLLSAIRYCRANSIQFLVIGKGSNCLFDDNGFNGCIILNRIDFLERIGPGTYRLGSGYPFNRLGIQCSNEGFTGLEFAGGIPGTLGGAAFMNAGANGQEIADSIDSVSIVTMDGSCRVLCRSELTFGYRSSCFQEMKDLAAITEVTLRLVPSASATERQRTYLMRRRKSQPVGERSAGSVFRNPPLSLAVSAGELIDKAGLKGFRVGGAMVSNVHANFFINCGGSTSKNMLQLIDFVKREVHHRFRIELEEEICFVPYNLNG